MLGGISPRLGCGINLLLADARIKGRIGFRLTGRGFRALGTWVCRH